MWMPLVILPDSILDRLRRDDPMTALILEVASDTSLRLEAISRPQPRPLPRPLVDVIAPLFDVSKASGDSCSLSSLEFVEAVKGSDDQGWISLDLLEAV